ncbi:MULTISPECIES: trans-sulfuration enzyme family protein [Prochlorococcus]|uniref:homocysteine desulfhydrase n=1 Tax=Prochlorococcus marinus (strain SARG / CCMP1375 / SS120) TaxID=167539 RepID=Q7VDH1_PROMA|nr:MULTISPECIES: PLP-dependent transferase [Prochlorococcus]AAP99451.1 Cystathionine beta-lyase/cystathionine gamma-synthase [Prochlorococcus marinus subsp. marinus str. CCMP1375]KGG11281.1 Cystathionine beta-lyase [Prochlorococcus marinus str. LG]KGG18765.1 Cystathionine beta-lyase [Prochlorococcus marinus str. SS2]KGG23038.1 Cystathionine beta-lyase [Prochlorococcus marinus str. SS35]KGG33745.1 Cystathionine beta-lyase [Prochlorococcus marinus str. SS51]
MESTELKEGSHPGINTRVIHHGESFAKTTGTVMPPIFQSSTFRQGNEEGFDYTRSGNPNFRILESVLASLEDCKYSTVFGSGVSAITAIASSLKSGDLVLCEENLYGCTVRLFEKVFSKFGLRTKWLDFSNPSCFDEIKKLSPAMIWLESPTNPLLKVLDLKTICTKAKENQIPVVVDNTFSTAILQKPLDLGASLSLTSTTKYINGHSDALGGAVCTQDSYWHEQMRFAQKALGLQASPFDCWLITRGVKTLPLRLQRQVSNATSLANQLAKNEYVQWISYPFRSDHPQYEIAKKQMAAGGAIITIRLKANLDQTYAFCERLKYFTMAESLGGVESLVCHPATMTHASVSSQTKEKLGISESLVRFSIGCEDVLDLDQDLKQSLEKLK